MSESKIHLNTIEEAIEDIRQGKVIIVVDDEDRENEGDFLAAAEKVTPEMINFMATTDSGSRISMAISWTVVIGCRLDDAGWGLPGSEGM